MPDKETVIKALRMCTRPVTRGCTLLPGTCPYEGKGCRAKMEEDALELLQDHTDSYDAMDQMERHEGFLAR